MDEQIITIESLYQEHKGALGMAWTAGTRGANKIESSQIMEFNVAEACDLIIKHLKEEDPSRPKLSLRMSHLLTSGVLKLHQEQVKNTQEEINAFCNKELAIPSSGIHMTKELPELRPTLEFPEQDIEPLRAKIEEITIHEDSTIESLQERFAKITFNFDPVEKSASSPSDVDPMFIIQHAQIIREDVPDVSEEVNRRSEITMDLEESQGTGKTREPENFLISNREYRKSFHGDTVGGCVKSDANCLFPSEMFTFPRSLMENGTPIKRTQASASTLSSQFEDTTLIMCSKRAALKTDEEVDEPKRFRTEQFLNAPPIENMLEMQQIEEPRTVLFSKDDGITKKLRYEQITSQILDTPIRMLPKTSN